MSETLIPTKNKRVRRTRAQIASDNAAKSALDAATQEPITRAAPRATASDFENDDGSKITRRSRRDGVVTDFEVPNNVRKPGWDYEYKTSRVMGQEVDASEQVEIYEGGWRPVKATEMKSLCPPGWDKPYIERRGQILYCRPMQLTEEAKNEDYEKAERQKRDKLEAALAGGGEASKYTKRHIDKLEISGEVGRHDQRR